MRKLLLTSVAMAALAAGGTVANAQISGPESGKDRAPAASSQRAPEKAGAPDEKSKPHSAQKADEGAKGAQSSRSEAQHERQGQNNRPAGAQKEDRTKGAQNQPSGSHRDMEKRQTTGGSTQDRQGAQNQPSGSHRDMEKRQTTGSNPQERQGAQNQPSGPHRDMEKRQTTGSNPQDRQGAQGAQREEQKGKSKSTAQKPNERSTTGQAPSNAATQKPNERGTAGQAPSASQPGRSTQDQNRAGQTGQDHGNPPNRQTTGQTQGTSAGQTGSRQETTSTSSSLTQDKQTKIKDVISKEKVESVNNVNVSVSVGTALPRSVRVHDVPREVVDIYPEFRGDRFTVVRDEIVIVEPRTSKIVAVIPRSGRGTTGTSTSVRETTGSSLKLAPEQRRIIRETVIKEQSAPRCQDVNVSVGETVPRTVHIGMLPQAIVRDIPEVKSYQFCLKDNEVVLIDPSQYRIVGVID